MSVKVIRSNQHTEIREDKKMKYKNTDRGEVMTWKKGSSECLGDQPHPKFSSAGGEQYLRRTLWSEHFKTDKL